VQLNIVVCSVAQSLLSWVIQYAVREVCLQVRFPLSNSYPLMKEIRMITLGLKSEICREKQVGKNSKNFCTG